jgi:hypothetical protein
MAIVGSAAVGCETETAGLGDGSGGSGGSAGAGGSLVTVTGGAHPVGDASAEADASHSDGASPDANGDVSVDVSAEAAPDVSADVAPGADGDAGIDGEAGTGDVVAADTAADAPSTMPDAQGDGGDASLPSPKVCAVQCVTGNDCPTVGLDHQSCNTSTHHCVSCLSDATCIAQQSAWAPIPCAADGDCAVAPGFSFGDYCVDVDGAGRCAFDASKVGMLDCMGADDMYAIKKFATADIVMVCANLSQTCDSARGTCVSPCASSCTPALGGNVCNATNGHCECASNADCGGTAPVCNIDIHQCECGTVADCSGADSGRTVVCN